MSYYNWPKIVANLSDQDLIKIISEQRIEPEEKVNAAINELAIRGLDTDKYVKKREDNNKNTPIDKYAGFWPRLYSLLLDFLILLPLTILIQYINASGKYLYLFTLLPTILVLLWYNIYLVSRFGGTPGKLIVGIKIISLSEQPVTWQQAFLRYSVLLALTIFGCTITIFSIFAADTLYYDNLGWMQKQQYLTSLSPIMFKVYSWATNIWIYGELIVLLMNEKKELFTTILLEQLSSEQNI
jgi:uncharacterized RDD family membrane protein YckC